MQIKIQSVILLLLLLVHKIKMSINDNPIVATQLGIIKGSLMETRLGKVIYSFRGIYYAEPPNGENRFKVWRN